MKKQRLLRLLPILLLLAALILPASGLAGETGVDVTAFLSGLSASVTQNGVSVPEGGTLTNDPISVRFDFGIPVSGDEPVPSDPIRKGDFAEFELSSGFSLESGTWYELKSGDILVGHVTISTVVDVDGVKHVKARVDFDGDEDVYNGELNAVSAFFTADFNYDGGESGGGSGEDTVSILEKDYTVVIPPGEIVYSVKKSGTVNLAAGTITWTAKVDAVQNGVHIDLGGYIFEDGLSGAGDYVPGTFVVGSTSPTPAYAGNKLSYTFPSGTEGPQTITYKTKIPDDKYYASGEQTLTNRAALKDSPEHEVKFDRATVTFEPGWIAKSGASNETVGVYDPTNRTITWTILVSNVGSTAMQNVQITDTLPAGLTFDKATLQIDGGAITEINSEPSGGIYNITALNNNAVLKITAKVPDEAYTAGITTYTNSANVKWGGLPSGHTGVGSGDVGVGIGFAPITKSGTANTQTGQVTWTVNVDTRGQNIPNLVVYDLLVYGDDASILPETLPGGIALSDLTPQFNQRYESWGSGSAGLSPSVTPLTVGGEAVADLLVVSGLSNNTVNTFTFTSQILDPDIFAGNGRHDVPNTATLYSGSTRLNEATATVDYNGTSLKKSMLHRDDAAKNPIDPNGVTTNLAEGFNYEDKTVVFRLSVNSNGMNLTALENADGNTSGTITITDTLPDGWVYTDFADGGNYKLLAGTGVTPSGVITADSVVDPLPTGFDASVSGANATFTFTELKDRYVILLRATPTSDEAAELFNDNKTTIVDNTVTMTAQNWTGFDPSSTQSVSVKSELAGKSAAVNASDGTVI